MTTGEYSFNCQEESSNRPVANNYFYHPDIYTLCQEKFVIMVKIPILCACGCNDVVWNGRTYVRWHHLRGTTSWNAGKKGIFTKETLLKMSLKAKARTHSVESNLKRSQKLKGVKKPPRTEEHRKHLSESHKGDKSFTWNGGTSFLPYCPKFNKSLKEQIRERDNKTCQLCGKKENGRKLHVHHVHYDKPNCNPDLVSLCIFCHNKTRFNREYWENFFMNKLNTKVTL